MKKKVLICNLGGTIGMVEGDDGALRPPETDAEFKKAVEGITSLKQFEDVEFEFVTLSTKDSTDLCPEEWEEFISYINKRQKDFDCIVCPHGTDTMAYTASAVSFGFYSPETNGSALFTPIVFTGAQKPISEPGGDGERNIISAIQTGLEADKKNITDVLISFGDNIIQAVKAYKTSDSAFNAFDSVDGVHIGKVTALGVTLHNAELAITSKPTWRKQMAITYNAEQPPPNAKFMLNVNDGKRKADGYVARVALDPGVTEKAIEAYIKDKDCLGIVMTALGAGNIPDSLMPCIERAITKYHVPIFAVSPFIGGEVHADMYESAAAASKAGVSFLRDQSGATAWVKAHWILSNGLGMDSTDFILNMQRVFRGEGSVSESKEVLPSIHEITAEDPRDNFRKRVLRNRTAIEGYRRAKGLSCRFIHPMGKKKLALPAADSSTVTERKKKQSTRALER